jgi:hypothetical protein
MNFHNVNLPKYIEIFAVGVSELRKLRNVEIVGTDYIISFAACTARCIS